MLSRRFSRFQERKYKTGQWQRFEEMGTGGSTKDYPQNRHRIRNVSDYIVASDNLTLYIYL